MKKIAIIGIILVLLSPLVYLGIKEHQKQVEIQEFNQKAQIFQDRYNELNESQAEDLVPILMNDILTEDIFKGWSQDRINHQIAYFYKNDGEDKIKLCSDMIKYKVNKFNMDEDPQEQIQNYINNLQEGNLDRIDKLIVKSFEDAVERFQKQYEYELLINDRFLY